MYNFFYDLFFVSIQEKRNLLEELENFDLKDRQRRKQLVADIPVCFLLYDSYYTPHYDIFLCISL